MPQLNPSPWLLILLFSWFIFLTMLPSKTQLHTFPNMPSTQNMCKQEPEPWTWPWA
uniref:ATP synthase complex subunit 8 n=1 Tax=Latimeria menadoensis TaxID=106881 RepID=Q5DTD9_LATME|nr:ATP synthase F0 subunit 8 [Latimeria menadoensis]ACX31753.1 ATP synthase F0 subunit 8 [Latimeria menadoensis]BAD90820.1 ATPase subunits 8 [Latimeria menadoensis]